MTAKVDNLHMGFRCFWLGLIASKSVVIDRRVHHKTLRATPAMAAGVTKRLWEIGDIVDVLEAFENWRAAA